MVLDEINAVFGTDYRAEDVYFKFQREVITNAQDNAQIELLNAQKQGQQLGNIMTVANTLDDGTVIQEICSILDIDYEEIRDKLAAEKEDIRTVQKTLEGITPDDESGAG